MRTPLLFFFLLLLLNTTAQTLNIIPEPVKTEIKKGSFTISASTQIVVTGKDEQPSADFLNAYLQQFYGFRLSTGATAGKNAIRLSTKKSSGTAKEGAYTLDVSTLGVSITGDSHSGTFYGIQTLIQLLPTEAATSLQVPAVAIQDYPRFGYRGLHLDVSRHFFPVEFVKKYIDYLALHKMNYFHWHLTDDQGWRIEIKKYPLLTEVGGCRDGTIIGRYPGKGNDSIKYCGFYTQEQIKEVVAYATQRYVTVLPEIELPGHASAAIAAYPQLSCFPEELPKKVVQSWGVYKDVFAPTDYTFKFLEDVFDEVMPLFPSKYIHVGGDECPKDNWKRSAFCQQLIKEKNLKDEHGLQSYFIQRIEKYINSKGKQIIGWDEILEGGLAPNAAVMSWRGEQGGIDAASQNHYVVMTPGSHLYLDHAQTKTEDSVTIGGLLPVEKTYSYEPLSSKIPAGKEQYILGAQGNVWTEYMKNTSKVEYMIFPRASAISEVLWSPREKRNWPEFKKKLSTQYKRYDLWKANYNKAE